SAASLSAGPTSRLMRSASSRGSRAAYSSTLVRRCVWSVLIEFSSNVVGALPVVKYELSATVDEQPAAFRLNRGAHRRERRKAGQACFLHVIYADVKL